MYLYNKKKKKKKKKKKMARSRKGPIPADGRRLVFSRAYFYAQK